MRLYRLRRRIGRKWALELRIVGRRQNGHKYTISRLFFIADLQLLKDRDGYLHVVEHGMFQAMLAALAQE
jgi:hypothetical protein